MMNHTHISVATLDDVTLLNTLVNSAYRGDSSRKGWTTEADLLGGIRINEEGLRTMLQNPASTILKFEVDGQLTGCVYLEKHQNSLYLGMLTVSPEAQTNGIGKQLLSAAEQVALDQQCTAITMTVISVRHELIAWYQRRGYQSTGETKPFPTDVAFGLPNQPLEFLVMTKNLSVPATA